MAAAAACGSGVADPPRDAHAELAPLLKLHAQLLDAIYKERRFARARVLAARMLAAAETTVPADSLVLAQALRAVLMTRMLPLDVERGDSYAARLAVWRADPKGTLDLSRRCAALLATRAAARTLFTLSPLEGAWCHASATSPGGLVSVDTLLVMSALEALTYWPAELRSLSTSLELRTLLTASIRTVVESFAHGYTAICAASNRGYRPDVLQCFPVGIFAVRCRYPDIAPLARTVCDDACLKGLRDKFMGPQGERIPNIGQLPPHLRLLLHDARMEAAPAHAAFNAAYDETMRAEAFAEAELAAARARMEPLLECVRKVTAAEDKGRVLQQRAAAAALLELAEATLPPDSLALAHVLEMNVIALDTPLEAPASLADLTKTWDTTWNDDNPALQASRRSSAILVRRCDTHTLLVARPDEEVWLKASIGLRSPLYLIAQCAVNAIKYWPPALLKPDAEGAKVIAAAVCALVHAHVHDFTVRLTRRPDDLIKFGTYALSLCGNFFSLLHKRDLLHFMRNAIDEKAANAVGNLLIKQFHNDKAFSNLEEQMTRQLADIEARKAAHGLHPCALPTCGAMEPHPQAFKLCGRCRKAKYCCREHQIDDWKRHKQADSCGQQAE